jgi:hypothetical protein
MASVGDVETWYRMIAAAIGEPHDTAEDQLAGD